MFLNDFNGSNLADQAPEVPANLVQRPRQQQGSACEECRRKRIRCDRGTPQCEACANSGVNCVVRTNSSPRGPKKGYIKTLQKQIENLQAQLSKQQESNGIIVPTAAPSNHTSTIGDEDGKELHSTPPTSLTGIISTFGGSPPWPPPMTEASSILPSPQMGSGLVLPLLDNHQSPLPTQITLGTGVQLSPMICTDLDQLFFDRVCPFAPVVQKYRYLAWSKQPDKSKPRTCLQYIMWTLAASLSSQFQLIRSSLYRESRQLLETLDSEWPEYGVQPYNFPIEQVQAWLLLSIYELTSDVCNFQRGMISAGRAFRLIQLMRLHELDKPNHPSAGPDSQLDWIDIETMRRTFWLAFIIDRLTSAIDGLPLSLDEQQIHTRLPAPEAHFLSGRPTVMCFISELINGVGSDWPSDTISNYTESIVVATMCGRTLEHKQWPLRRHPHHVDQNWNATYEFCRGHQFLDTLLRQHVMTLSNNVLSTIEHPEPIIIFAALMAYMALFMLCETIETMSLEAEERGMQMADSLLVDHQQRCLDSVQQLRVLISMLGQLNHFQTHPFTPIPLLLSGRFCMSHVRLNDAFSSLIPDIKRALQALTDYNGLAQGCLQLLGLDRPASQSQSESL